jgi:hypothetical protein
MAEYRYEVVSCNGHGVHGPQFKRFRDARAHAQRIVENRPTTVVLGPYEIQRVEYVEVVGGSRRYSMRQRSRWVPWSHKRDHTVRKPDYLWYEPFDPARREQP